MTKTLYGFFDAPRSFRDEDADAQTFSARIAAADEVLGDYHRLADIYREYPDMNNLATLNRMAGKGPVPLDERLLDLLAFGKEMYEISGGAINIMMGSVLSLWHDLREEGERLPTEEELAERGEHVRIDALVLDFSRGTAEITDARASVDVGAIAKGYACGKAAEVLRAAGARSFVIDLGGNLGAIGKKPDGKPWRTGIRNPDPVSSIAYPAFTELADGFLSTSGGYERFYIVDGVRYHHLIDPQTLLPADRYASVSVGCTDGGVADALSTALFLLSREDGRAAALRAKESFGLGEITVIYIDANGAAETLVF